MYATAVFISITSIIHYVVVHRAAGACLRARAWCLLAGWLGARSSQHVHPPRHTPATAEATVARDSGTRQRLAAVEETAEAVALWRNLLQTLAFMRKSGYSVQNVGITRIRIVLYTLCNR